MVCFIFQPESLCLVIGGGGFLGRHIVDKLLEEKYKVQVFDIRITFDDERVKFFVGDLCKEEVSHSLVYANFILLSYIQMLITCETYVLK